MEDSDENRRLPGEFWWVSRDNKTKFKPFDLVARWAAAGLYGRYSSDSTGIEGKALHYFFDVVRNHWDDSRSSFDFDCEFSDSVADLFHPVTGMPPFPEDFSREDMEQTVSAMWLYAVIKRAVRDGDLSISSSGYVFGSDVAKWAESKGELPPFLMPKAPQQSIVWLKDDVNPPMAQTSMMALLREGREYWWGGIDPEKQYRGKIPAVAEWFKKRGAGQHAEAMASIIAPDWVRTEMGGGYRKREYVPHV